jgi:eukaryotic-like serine/threonine-protein kinase
MRLAIGFRLGSYEVVSALGAGGMGEVYRARDTRLERLVAIKILPDSFAQDPERLARFQREAKMLAALNHPHIGGIHGLEEANGVSALVLELVEGPTLADRIAQGPIPIDDALPIARQIAEALEAAHEQGIVHRDLKPANVKVRDDGTVKVLDFGLAKALEPAGGSSSVSQSPTITTPAMTQAGLILGTAAYMSPEQAKGKAADKRSDVWAFGCVLYEMLTGRRAFDGEDVSDTLAAVLRGEPDWTAIPRDVPQHVRTIVRRCLEKDRKTRIPEIVVARFMLDDTSGRAAVTSAAQTQAIASRAGRRGWIAAALLGVAFLMASGLAAFFYFRPAPSDQEAIRFRIALPTGGSLPLSYPSPGAPPLAVSPDGRRIAFVALTQNTQRLWIRSLESVEAQELPGTDGASGPFWSPDSRELGFFADGRLKKIDVTGGRPVTLCDAPAPHGGSWSQEGFIIFGSTGKALHRVAAAGGVPTAVTILAPGELTHSKPSFLPDGRHFFYRAFGTTSSGEPIYISSTESTDRAIVIERPDASNVMYAAGYLLFLRGTTLMAQPFDTERLVLTGEPVPVAEQVMTFAAAPIGLFSASETGVLAYVSGTRAGNQLTWFDRSGKALGTLVDSIRFESVELAPDGKRVAIAVRDPAPFTLDIWMVDVARSLQTRFTFDPANEPSAIWSPGADQLAFGSNRSPQPALYFKPSAGPGSERLILASPKRLTPTSWSLDGRFLLYTTEEGPAAADIWVLPLSGEPKPQPYLETNFREEQGRFSPDGRWVASVSNESGRSEVYVTAFPQPGEKSRLSSAGGRLPRWRRDGKEIFYVAANNVVMAAEVNGQGAAFEVGAARPLFEIPSSPGYGYDVAEDGQRFLVNVPADRTSRAPLDVIVNWTAGLKTK